MDERTVRTAFHRALSDSSTDWSPDPTSWHSVVADAERRRTVHRAARIVAVGVALIVVITASVIALQNLRDDSHDPASVIASGPSWSFEPIPNPPGTRGACVRLTVDSVRHDACITLPGPSVWRVAGENYVITAEPDPTVSRLSADKHELLTSCTTDSLIMAVDAYFGGDSDPFLVAGCTAAHAFVDTQPLDQESDEGALLFEWDGARWEHLATIDDNADRSSACQSLPSEDPPNGTISAREFCELLG